MRSDAIYTAVENAAKRATQPIIEIHKLLEVLNNKITDLTHRVSTLEDQMCGIETGIRKLEGLE